MAALFAKAHSTKSKRTIKSEVEELWTDYKKSKRGSVDEINKAHVKKVEESQTIHSSFKKKDFDCSSKKTDKLKKKQDVRQGVM